MGKMIKLAILGAAGGATYATVQAYRNDEPIDVLAGKAARVGAEGAAAGVVLGLVLTVFGGRKRRRKAKKHAAKLAKSAAKKGIILEAAKAAAPPPRLRDHMPKPSHILSSPVRLTGAPRVAHLPMLVSADALARRGRSTGHDVTWVAASLAGDLASQRAVERALAREGLDRQT